MCINNTAYVPLDPINGQTRVDCINQDWFRRHLALLSTHIHFHVSSNVNMRQSYSDRLGAQTQLALGAAVQSSSSSSVFGNSFSRHFIRSFDKPGVIVALITKEVRKQKLKRLKSMGARKKSDLRAASKARETKSQRQRQPIISTPITEFRQHLPVYHHGPMFENRQSFSQPLIQHNKLAKRYEALGSHPIHNPRESWHNGDDGASCDANLSAREVPQHYRIKTEPGENG